MPTFGIDIGGKQHAVARCREGQAKADRPILRVPQDRAGFDALDAWLARQDEPVELVAMESGGHYWMALASHLGRRGIPVALVNPLSARYFAKSQLGRTESDPADARSLALMAMRERPVPRDPPSHEHIGRCQRRPWASAPRDDEGRAAQGRRG